MKCSISFDQKGEMSFISFSTFLSPCLRLINQFYRIEGQIEMFEGNNGRMLRNKLKWKLNEFHCTYTVAVRNILVVKQSFPLLDSSFLVFPFFGATIFLFPMPVHE